MLTSDHCRQAIISQAKTVVIKVGTNVLADGRGRLNRDRIERLSEQIVRIRQGGRRVALVSSGAIGAGVGALQLPVRPTELPQLQACAAVGQSVLMRLYQEALSAYSIQAAQLLLTAADFDCRARYLNIRNTLFALFHAGCLPIINENDTVSVAEIKFGDNDHLAALVANLLQAPLLILLTNVDGLYSSDPGKDPQANLLPVVARIDRSISELAGTTKSSLGTGGMRSKLRAARLTTAAGGAVIIANGSNDGILDQIFANNSAGTLFLPHSTAIPAWKRWLGFTARPKGTLVIDEGAEKALLTKGKSLLPVGVKAVLGLFGKGDLVAINNMQEVEIGRGLVNYSSEDARRIAGLRTDQLVELSPTYRYAEIIHRDNFASSLNECTS